MFEWFWYINAHSKPSNQDTDFVKWNQIQLFGGNAIQEENVLFMPSVHLLTSFDPNW